jgi:plasmid stability protein
VPTITLKNVPKSLHGKLTKRAKAHKRSLNQEAIACLEETLQGSEPVPGHVWEERFQKVRATIQAPPLTDDFLEWAVNHGRA